MVQREGEDQSVPVEDNDALKTASNTLQSASSSTVSIADIRVTLDLLEHQISQYREALDQNEPSMPSHTALIDEIDEEELGSIAEEIAAEAATFFDRQLDPQELPAHRSTETTTTFEDAPSEDMAKTVYAPDDLDDVVEVRASEPEPEPLEISAVEMPELFAELQHQLEFGLHETASVSVFRDGEEMVKYLSSSIGSGVTPMPEPLLRAFSSGKAMAAAVIWRLLDAGTLEIDAPIANYWPEFAQRGKTSVTLRHVLTHTAGLPLDFGRGDVDWGDWGRMSDILASMPLDYEPGKVVHYHAITFGVLVAETASRATGLNFTDLFEREVASPLKLADAHFTVDFDDDDVLRRVKPLRVSEGYFDPDMPRKMDWLLENQVLSPGATCITTASDLAKLYSIVCNGGMTPKGEVWLSETAATNVYAIHASAYNIEDMMKADVCQGVWRFGNQPNRTGAASGSSSFGHGGMGTSIAWGDPDHRISAAIITDTMQEDDLNDRRLNRISAAIRKDLGVPAGAVAELS